MVIKKKMHLLSFIKKAGLVFCLIICFTTVLCSCQMGTDENQFTTLNEKYVSSEQSSENTLEDEAAEKNQATEPASDGKNKKTAEAEKKAADREKKERKEKKKHKDTSEESAKKEETRETDSSTAGPNTPESQKPEKKKPDSQSKKEDTATKKESTPKPKDSTPKPKNSEKPDSKETCTILIECSTILKNIDALKPSKASFVPANGKILEASEVPIEKGDSVYDILYRTCVEHKIHIEAKYTPAYSTYYVEGINQLYEFDCGNLSGWMYLVNGKKPNYGCSSYKVSAGDFIVWSYSCNAGKDIDG